MKVSKNSSSICNRKDRTMTNGKELEAIRRYVEETCQAFVSAHKSFRRIEFRHSEAMKGDFIKVTTVYGFAKYYDVTRFDLEMICRLICIVIAEGASREKITARELTDAEAIREVEELFYK